MNVDALNKIRSGERPDPNRKTTAGGRRIDFYYIDDDRLLILGSTDDGYIFWSSETDLNDEETNRAVFDRISAMQPTVFRQSYADFITTSFRRGGLYRYYHAAFRSADGRKTLDGDEILWETPFGSVYVRSEEKNNGRYFARGVREYREKLRDMCRWRLSDGLYLGVMRHYLELLSDRRADPVSDYKEKKALIEIIRDEEYLLCSEDEDALMLYLRLDGICSDLYNEYMYVVR